MKIKKIFKMIALSLIALFIIICFILAAIMKIRYPNPSENTFLVGDSFSFLNYEIKVTDYETTDLGTFCENHNLNNPLGNITKTENIRCCLVTLDIKNISNQEVSPELYQIVISANNYSNGLDLDIFRALNEDSSVELQPTIKPGEAITISLPYTIYGSQLGCMEGDPFQYIPFELTISLYPEKYVVKLNEI